MANLRHNIVYVLLCCIHLHKHQLIFANTVGNDRTCSNQCNQCKFDNVCDPPTICTRENIALGKQASMSSDYTAQLPTQAACLAVDGYRETSYDYNSGVHSPNCLHTMNGLDEWWEVDLGRNYTINNITVYRRNNQPVRMANMEVTINNHLCYKFPSDTGTITEKIEVICTRPHTGQIVKFTTHNEFINICEVEVWVCKPGMYGENCDQTCSRRCSDDDICDNYYGQTCACDYGCNFSEACQPVNNCRRENVAIGKTATMSSEYTGGGPTGPACLAVNGNTSTAYQSPSGASTPNCIHTKNGENEWWQVDLGRNYTVTDITVYRRNSFPDRMKSMKITVDEQHCYTFPTNANEIPEKKLVQCNPPLTGRIVKFATQNQYVSLCEVEIWVCREGLYSSNCTEQCGKCKDSCSCNSVSGECTNGCEDGYEPPFCNETCRNNTYGPNCSLPCGRCKNAARCNSTSGNCDECELHFTIPKCKGCDNGFYGSNCTKCGFCKHPDTCDSINGTCPNLCEDGYEKPFCNEMCSNGTYGPSCSKRCGNCLVGSSCNATNGVCPAGCDDGYITVHCNETCSNIMYGPNCSKECGHCSGDRNCNITNGVCPDGCDDGYITSLCNENCPNGTWGRLCNMTCGNCSVSSCRHDTGTCENGCIPGFAGERCLSDPNYWNKQTADNTGLIVGIVVGVVLLIAILLGIFLFMRRRGFEFKGRYFKSTREVTSRPDGANSLVSHSTEPTINTSTAKPKVAVKPRIRENVNEGASRDDTRGPVYENVVLGSSTSLYNKHQYHADDVSSVNDADVQEYDILVEDSEQLYGNDEMIYAALKSNQNLEHIQHYLVDKLTSGALLQEFKSLKKNIRKPHQNALLPQNIRKNRFKATVPYDCNRVILRDGYEEGGANDYVNASFVKGVQSDSQYIAAQGPRDNTVTDFWRMVLQERVTNIVMVTSLQEGGKNKCYEYWPAKDTTQTYGPVKVTGLDVQCRAYFFTRTFRICLVDFPINYENVLKGGEHIVTQYHFTAWPDHGVPTVTSLVDFWRFVKSRINAFGLSTPLLVHCSAGVGRTGTFIGLDIGMDECLLKGKINIAAIVDRMRDDRTIMVQASEQYLFLYKALLEAYTGRETKLSINQFETVISQSVSPYTPNERIDKEFQVVMQMRSLTAEQSHTIGTADENISKNRSEAFLPSDEHIVYLTEHVPNRNQYINAVYMSTFTKCRGAILTQLPLPDTLVDFWRLIFGNEVTTIVSLGGIYDETNIQNFCPFWPLTKEAIQIDPYCVTLKSLSRLGKHSMMYTLNLNKQDDAKSREIQVLRYGGWSSEIPDKSDIYQLVEILDTTNTTIGPIVIQCTDGVTKSGLFCCLRDIISRVTLDREVDVYMTVRHVQSVRSEAVTKVEQYRFCYEVAQEKVREQNVYANT